MTQDLQRAAGARPVPMQWRPFLRAWAEEVDSQASAGERDDMLRRMGRRMAQSTPLPAAGALDALEIELNDALDLLGWGAVQLRLDVPARALVIRHLGLPRIGALGDPPGAWLAPVLEGMYEAWFAQQPGSQAALVARLVSAADGDGIVLRYGRAGALLDNARPEQQIGAP